MCLYNVYIHTKGMKALFSSEAHQSYPDIIKAIPHLPKGSNRKRDNDLYGCYDPRVCGREKWTNVIH